MTDMSLREAIERMQSVYVPADWGKWSEDALRDVLDAAEAMAKLKDMEAAGYVEAGVFLLNTRDGEVEGETLEAAVNAAYAQFEKERADATDERPRL